MNKLKCYEYLSKINDKGISVNEHLKTVVQSDDVPVSILKFIDKHYPLSSIRTFEDIYEKRHKNPLYKNLVNENASAEDRAIALSSLLTRAMIRMSNISESKRKDFASEMKIKEISEALNDYSYNKNTDKLNVVFNNTRSFIKELF